jgi:hypothetical protein
VRDVQAAGVWNGLRLALLNALRRADKLNLGRFSMDGSTYRAPEGAYTGSDPTDRGKPGSKRHFITDRQGILVMFSVTGANRHDSVVFDELVDALLSLAGKRGRPRRGPGNRHANKGCDCARCHAHLKRRDAKDCIAREASNTRTDWAPLLGRRAHARLAGRIRQTAHSF